jgi:8-oxo-dGTP pyrophosphatase MutT (NUDIX family)
MKLYINDKYIQILKAEEAHLGLSPDQEFDTLEEIQPNSLRGLVLLKQSSHSDLNTLLGWIEYKKLPNLATVICQTNNYDATKAYIKSQFRIVKAAGGLVKKDDRFLMMHRLGKWDLPKGKLDKGEKTKAAAVREVVEECSIEVKLEEKICTTWHTYIQEGRRILKKTSWYTMHCIDDSHMEPQYVENIDELRWMTFSECEIALKNSYRSIQGVFEAYIKNMDDIKS